ncbi:MAG: family 10 glycosylhydrolase [Armatimonadota bacterium]|nr:family 10 glycosylhydrolase [Armatimonadota bacterium]MDR7452970.1 family 10 glycosylhydrolase [Armatimonadota bacterium]MDR7456370.1 family 10 glycosylhydrolase [Armatimonadota bacterium]MDR7496719.1 family 10 glycosylhydrolase [Armatimonadota bacterium]
MRVRRAAAVVAALVCAMLVITAAAPGAAGAARVPRRALWIETSANLRALSTREGIRAVVARAAAAGFDVLVPEAKNAWGFVIYESDLAPHIRTSPVARAAYPAPVTWFPREFDPLQVLIEEARAAGLRVHAAVNSFGEGLALSPRGPVVGPAAQRPDWVSVHLRVGPDGAPTFVPSTQAIQIVFVNASHPEVAAYELGVIWEVVSRYDVDGIVLDRTRYAGVDADFSTLSRRQFEARLGAVVGAWPEDVLRPEADGFRPGPLFPAWIAWRASVIKGFVRAASRVVRGVRPNLPVGMYVGAWYPSIHEFGQNWARPDAPPLVPGWSPAWAEASLLGELDYLMIGLYHRTVTRWDALRQGTSPFVTVIGNGLRGRELTRGTPLLGGVWMDVYRGRRAEGAGAVRAAEAVTDGLMVFDLSNLDDGDWWSIFRR